MDYSCLEYATITRLLLIFRIKFAGAISRRTSQTAIYSGKKNPSRVTRAKRAGELPQLFSAGVQG
jgi:hypothetical protein